MIFRPAFLSVVEAFFSKHRIDARLGVDHRLAVAGGEFGDLILPIKCILFLQGRPLVDSRVTIEADDIDLVGKLPGKNRVEEVQVVIALQSPGVGHQARRVLPVQVVCGLEEVGEVGGA